MGIPKTDWADGNVPPGHEEMSACNVHQVRFVRRFADAERRRRPRRWISISEIAAYCAMAKAATHADLTKWDVAFRNNLTTALTDGRFNERGRSMILCLAPSGPAPSVPEPVRFTAQWARKLAVIHSDRIFLEYVFAHCWLHHRVCLSWFRGWLFEQDIASPRDWFSHADSSGLKQASPTVVTPMRALPSHIEANLAEWRKVFRSTGIGEEGMRELLSPETYVAKSGSLFEKLGPASVGHNPYSGSPTRWACEKPPDPSTATQSDDNLAVAVTGVKPRTTVAPRTEKRAREPRPAYSAEALSAWFFLRVKIWPKHDVPPTEAQDAAAAAAYFEGKIPRDKFREIRRAKVPENWLKPGPPSGRR